MKMFVPTLAAALVFSASTAFAQFPPVEPGFPIPASGLSLMPPDIARRLRCDLERVNRDLRRMMEVPPVAPEIPFDLPPAADTTWRHREESSYSCVNGAFTLRHRLNGIGYRVNGTMRGGVSCVKCVTVDDGVTTTEYPSIDEMPECHRAKVRTLLKSYESMND